MTPPASFPPRPATSALALSLTGTPLAVMLDIDGTLCDIVPDPKSAHVPEETREVIRRLVRMPGVSVALVTGRGVADARRVAELDGVYVCGNHGIETVDPSGHIEVDPDAERSVGALRGVVDELTALTARYPGVVLEDKHYTLGIHFRNADPDSIPALRAEMRAIDARAGVRAAEGNCIFDVRPAAGADKGVAVLRLAHRLGADAPGASLLFAGDDVTDEDAFRALREQIPHAVTISVGGRVPETRAEFSLPDPAALRDFLERVGQTRRAKDGGN